MITYEQLEEAIETGEHASDVLRDVLDELHYMVFCPASYGPDGHGDLPPCGECVVCLADRYVSEHTELPDPPTGHGEDTRYLDIPRYLRRSDD